MQSLPDCHDVNIFWYLLPVGCSVAALKEQVAAPELSHIIVTHVGPNRIPTLKLLLEEALTGRSAGTPLKLVVTNPAKAALEKGLAGKPKRWQPANCWQCAWQ